MDDIHEEVSPDQISRRSLVTPVKLLTCLLWITLLTACDPASLPFYSVDRLASLNNTLYAQINIRYSFGVGCCAGDIETMVFKSADFGQDWGMIKDVPQEVKLTWAEPIDDPKIACRTGDPNICYRLNGKEQIDISMDAGASWKKFWKFPVGRKEFLNRNSRLALLSPDPPNEKLQPDTIPKDIVILDLPDG